MNLDAQFFIEISFAVFAAGGAYVAIRKDLKYMHEKIERTERSVGKAHSRIDAILSVHKSK